MQIPPPRFPKNTRITAGFTLVELSIVLVIVGLLVAGIVTGVDMIKSAEIRNYLGELDKTRLAISTFESKYGGLPGDLPQRLAAPYGIFVTRGNFGHGRGDGDGVIAGWDSYGTLVTTGELIIAWNDLGASQLINGTYAGFDCNNAGACSFADLSTILPRTKLERSFLAFWGDFNTRKTYFTQIRSDATSALYGVYSSSAAITPLQAFQIDSKLDDGQPYSGVVTAIKAGGYLSPPPAATAAAPANGVCVSNAAGNPYNINTSTGGNTLACMVSIPLD